MIVTIIYRPISFLRSRDGLRHNYVGQIVLHNTDIGDALLDAAVQFHQFIDPGYDTGLLFFWKNCY